MDECGKMIGLMVLSGGFEDRSGRDLFGQRFLRIADVLSRAGAECVA